VKPFRYVKPGGPREAVAAMNASPHARYLAGGTNLVDLMKLGVETPDVLIDVSALPFGGIEEIPGGRLRVGAFVRNSDLAAHPVVRARWPVLSSSLLDGASGQLRNAATVGGNLLQRTRCLYFQDVAKPCNKRAPGTGCPAREGQHRDLAVLGASGHCVATHPGDMAVALAAVDASVHLLGPAGERTVPVTDFHRLPGDTPELDTVLAHGELITHITLEPLTPAARCGYRKARDRASFAFALASAAAVLDLRDDGTVREVRLAFGSLAARPWRATAAEEYLLGAVATEANFARAAEIELAAARPLRDNGHKVPLARNLAVQLLTDLSESPR
jgi:xanthine dehydrogenase YagS FAD-binding subunit